MENKKSLAVLKQEARLQAEQNKKIEDWTFSLVRLHACLKAASHDRDYIEQSIHLFRNRKVAKNVLDAFHKMDYIITFLDKIYEKEVQGVFVEEATEFTYTLDEYIEDTLKPHINKYLLPMSKKTGIS